MKKLSLLPVILLLSIGGIHAQQNKMTIRPGADKDAPTKMLADAGVPGYPTHQQLSAAEGKEKELAKKYRSASSHSFYIQHKGVNYWKRVKYNQDGLMLTSIEKTKNIALPDAAYKYIGSEYNGWQIKKTMVVKKMRIKSGAPLHSLYYKVHLQNGKNKKRVLLDEHGKMYSRK